MKSAFLFFSLVLSFYSHATVVDIQNSHASNVIEVFEEMQEQEEVGSSDNGWIHEFETDGLGQEMDHLSKIRRPAVVVNEEM